MMIAHFACLRKLSLLAAACAALSLSPCATAQTAFTYQGLLKSAGSPYSGLADVRFTLYDAPAAGNVIGAPVEILGTTLTDGVFTADLDFGALAFDGSARWLEIEVATPSGGAYALLTPRQAVNPVPYAMFAMNNAGSPFAYSGANGVFSGTGNVGIGTASPALGKLVVQSGTNNYGMVHTDGSVSMGSWVGAGGGWFGTLSNSDLSFATANGTSQMILKTGGNVGIGTTSPDGRLHLAGGPTWTSNGWAKSLNISTIGAIELGGGGATKYGIGSSLNGLYFFTTTTEAADVPALYYMTVNANRQVTIGDGAFTPNAAARLHVRANPTTGGSGMMVEAFGTNSRAGNFITNTGFCAVSGDYTSTGTFGLLGTANEGVYGSGGSGPRIGVTGVSAGNSGVVGGASVGTSTAGVFGYSTATNGNGIIGEANTGTSAYGVWGRATSGVGGYFSGGSYALIAAGKARVNTIEIIGGSDLAEPFDIAHFDEGGSEQDIEPGMVVVIDPSNPGALKVSTIAHDRKVAGIISGANDLSPGMVMKAEGGAFVDGEHPVALTGRVWCWCDAASGAIEPGDMLTTSDVAGHAMKAVDLSAAQGAIIGKAMTPLAEGERGLVLVLVNLQ